MHFVSQSWYLDAKQIKKKYNKLDDTILKKEIELVGSGYTML